MEPSARRTWPTARDLKIADGPILSGADLADGARSTAKIGNDNVTTRSADGSIVDADIANVSFAKVIGGSADTTVGLGASYGNVRLNLRAKAGIDYLLYCEENQNGSAVGSMTSGGNFQVAGSLSSNGGIITRGEDPWRTRRT